MKSRTKVLIGGISAIVVVCLAAVIIWKYMDGSLGQSPGEISAAADESGAPTATPKPTLKPTPTPIPLATTNVKIGKQVKEVVEVKGKFEKKKNVLKFRKVSGEIFKGGFFLKGKHVYFAGKNGEIVRGWYKYKGNTYYFTRKKGCLTDEKKIEDVKLGKYGIAKNSKTNLMRVRTYLKAASILKKISKSSDSKSKKLYKCYKWVMKYYYKRHRTMRQMMQQKGWKEKWDIVFANDIFDKHCGCCVSYSAAFALLAKECGYKKVTLCCDTGHAWDDIGGRLYDPLFAKGRSFEKNYNARYTDYRVNAAIKKKIS